MVNEVNNNGSSTAAAALSALEQRNLKNGRNAAQDQSPLQPNGDTVKLTDTATRLRELSQSVANQPVVDRQRVEQLRKAVTDGTYRIDAGGVADKLMRFESQLTATPRQNQTNGSSAV